jgi:hypothetical protein
MAIQVSGRRVLRRALRVLIGAFGTILLAWLGLAWYINAHKAEILARVIATLSADLRGDLRIRSMEPSLYRSFPDISLTLQSVSLRDSMWAVHRHSLLEVSELYVRVNPFALLSQRTEIKKITAAHGSIFLYSDSAGYSNTYLLARRDTAKKNRTALISRFGLKDVHLWFVNDAKQKLFHLYFENLDGRATRTGDVMDMHIKSDAHIHEFNFNVSRGSYLHDQPLHLDMPLRYHLADKHLEIPDHRIRIARSPVSFGGNFYFNRSPAAFNIRLHTGSIAYKTAVSWMSPNISRRLESYDFSKPLALNARISGVMKYRNIPLVNLTYRIEDNRFHTPWGDIDDISYNGSYTNEAVQGAGHGDDNSRIAMYALSGSWQHIPFQSDTIAVTNLLRPVVKARIRSSFDVPAINGLVGGQVMSFDKGRATADLRYDGGILPDDPTPYTINGYVRVTDAGFTYLPRDLAFTNAGATLLFKGDNLLFRDITLRSRNSSIRMEGEALHFLRFYFTDPGKVSLSWKARGPMVNLNDFIGFAGKRRAAPRRVSAARMTRIGRQLDRVLAASTISLDAQVDRMVYKRFTADAVIAKVVIAQTGIVLRQVQISNGGGTLGISGMVNQSAPNNPFTLNARVRDADVARLFSGFDNFGQSAIVAANLRGRVIADADLKGNVTEGGAILKNSLRGSVTFNLKDGQINGFAPFEKIGRFIFKKRNLSAVTVKDLQGQLEVAGDKIYIRPMTIRTSVVNMNVQGVYGLQGGTDIYLEIPLRNPEKEEAKTPVGMLLRRGKGFVVHLRAQDETGAGVKIGWDPRRRGRKATGEKLGENLMP